MTLEIPENLGALTPDELDNLREQVRTAASELRENTTYNEDTTTAITELSAAADKLADEYTRRADIDASRSGLDNLLSGTLAEPAPVEETPSPAPEAVPEETPAEAKEPALVAATISDLKPHTTNELPAVEPAAPTFSLVAASGLPGYEGGETIPSESIGHAVSQRLAAHAKGGSVRTGEGVFTPRGDVNALIASGNGTPTGRGLRMGNTVSQRVFSLSANDGRDMYTGDAVRNMALGQQDARDWASALQTKRHELLHNPGKDWRPRNMVAAGFSCGPSDSIWDVCLQASDAGMLALPTRTMDRGTIEFSDGYDFSDILAEVITMRQDCDTQDAGDAKTCAEVPCATTTTACATAYYACLTAGLLQRRAWPESVDTFARGVLLALKHNENAGIIAEMVAGSDDAGTMATCADDDAFTAILFAVTQAIADLETHSYLDGGYEVVMPRWARKLMQSALLRRRAIDDPVRSDAYIDTAFASIGASIHWVYGWQDAHTAMVPADLPGGEDPGTGLPSTVDFMIYPAGTWAKGRLDVVNLDTIYDSTGLSTNTYTALFAEVGASALKLCPHSRVYTVEADACGCGCGGGSV